jgi:hypothetical protein
MKKKYLSIILVLALGASALLAGCGSQADSAGGDAATDADTQAEAAADTDAEAQESADNVTDAEADAAGSKLPDAEIPEGAQKIEAGGALVIDASAVTEQATYYLLDVDGTYLEVLAIKAPDGSVRTAFNTCQVCFDSGRGYYEQEGAELVCQNCGNRFTADKVEVETGGCNPVPITSDMKTVAGDEITISYDLLVQAREIFSNWKA